MEKGKFQLNKYMPLVCAILLIVLGVLFCFGQGLAAINWIMGMGIIVLGLVFGIYAAINTKRTLVIEVLIACAIVALGIIVIDAHLAETIFGIIPWLLVTVGVCAIVDAFLELFVRKSENKNKVFAIELTCGAAAVTLGLCVRFIDAVKAFMYIVFGIALIVLGIYIIVKFCLQVHEEKKGKKDKKKPVKVAESEVIEVKDAEEDKEEEKTEEAKA